MFPSGGKNKGKTKAKFLHGLKKITGSKFVHLRVTNGQFIEFSFS